VTAREYPLKSYELTSLATLEQFWWDMYEICVKTPLGASSNFNGKEITVEVSQSMVGGEQRIRIYVMRIRIRGFEIFADLGLGFEVFADQQPDPDPVVGFSPQK